MTIKKSALVIFILLFLTACTQKIIPNPDVGFSIDGFNQDISISTEDQWNTFKIGDETIAFVTLQTDKSIYAPLNFNIMIFEYNPKNECWKKIESAGNYHGDQPNLGPELKNAIVAFSPKIEQENNKPVLIFISIYGYEIVDGEITETKIGAYDTFYLYP